MNNIYTYIYGTLFRYFQKIWGKESAIVSFNVVLGLSFSMMTFIGSILYLLEILFDVQVVFMLSDKVVSISLMLIIAGTHYFMFEHKDKYKEVMKGYEKLLKKEGNHTLKTILVYAYIFGSILSLMCLALVSVNLRNP